MGPELGWKICQNEVLKDEQMDGRITSGYYPVLFIRILKIAPWDYGTWPKQTLPRWSKSISNQEKKQIDTAGNHSNRGDELNAKMRWARRRGEKSEKNDSPRRNGG